MDKIKMQFERESLFVVVNEPQGQIYKTKTSRNTYLYKSLVKVWLSFIRL